MVFGVAVGVMVVVMAGDGRGSSGHVGVRVLAKMLEVVVVSCSSER